MSICGVHCLVAWHSWISCRVHNKGIQDVTTELWDVVCVAENVERQKFVVAT